jgi:hypothetical protein
VQQRQPQPARQLDHARVGKELGEVRAHRLGRGRRRRAEVDEEDAVQDFDSALDSSFAVTSTIGTTRS